ncbi:heme-degrading domain-containing protein [Hoeflea sp.]|uniref:heme-degrading domain-containing protein n=1 Tax=Hoeflea sp. TaxID=1940281 RepID=UPI0019C22DDD|nr:heme-degrading domain-containing protein [Hoeflea sp.]MBC7281153.1 heme-degrading domain-containing protein [Hoeflea sp.]
MTIADDTEILKRQEEALRFVHFSEADAWALGTLMRQRAAEMDLPLVIDIQLAGRRLFFAALPGTSPDNEDWVRRKINVVMRYHKCSYRVSRELAAGAAPLDENRGVCPLDMAPHGGCFPIHIKGSGVVGTVTVSGIPQREDHRFVFESLCAFLDVDPGPIALGSGD